MFFFVRNPKTGSSSILHLMQQNMEVETPWYRLGVCTDLHDPNALWYTDRASYVRRWDAATNSIPADTHLAGHIPGELVQRSFPHAEKIVFVRNPLDCLISGYYFALSLGHIPPVMGLLDFVKAGHRRNWQSLMVGDPSWYAFVGVYENFTEDVETLKHRYHWQGEIPHLNQGDEHYQEKREEWLKSDRLRNLVSTIHGEDMRMYSQVLQTRGISSRS